MPVRLAASSTHRSGWGEPGIICAKSAIVDWSCSAPRAIFAFGAASIFRLVFFIIRSVYHDGAALVPIKPQPAPWRRVMDETGAVRFHHGKDRPSNVPIAFILSARKVAKRSRGLHQDGGDKHAYRDRARLH
jgi:hypothetical protein